MIKEKEYGGFLEFEHYWEMNIIREIMYSLLIALKVL